ncbi:SH3 domain-containing protein [Streptomyces sp. NPDC048255]|uniref:SH3 domain-containing protein n=1 Tax=Streptomyces sp. NPDC048255 TaxID=3154713 RepID=UPI0033E163C2
MTVTAARRIMSPRRSAARTAAVAALSAAALLGGGLTAQAAAPARTTGAVVELAPATVLATRCYYRVNATGGLVIRSGPGTSYTRVGSYPNGATVLASASTTNGFRNVGTNRWVSATYLVRITSYPCE